MSDGPEKQKQNIVNEIDIRLDGLLGELGRALGEAIDRLGDGVSEVHRTENIQTNRGPIRAEAGIRMRMGGLDMPSTTTEPKAAHKDQEAAPTEKTASAPPTRTISATILDEPDLWSLTADMPGVTREDIDLNQIDDALSITARSTSRAYQGCFPLPSGLTLADIQVSFVNGILDLTARRDGVPKQ